jgi:hypothetical protein
MNKIPTFSLSRDLSSIVSRSWLCLMLAVLPPLAQARDIEKPAAQTAVTLRPPAVPLVACDPYFSIWSPADKLTDADTVHWTGKQQAMHGRVIIDGKPFGIIGKWAAVPALPQINLEVLPTRTIATFEGQGIGLTLTFMTPALPQNLDIMARPVTYVIWDAHSVDGKEHRVFFADFGVSSDVAVNEPGQNKTTSVETNADFVVTRIGSVDQPILQKKGDDVRIDWGYFYMALPRRFTSEIKVGSKPVSQWLILAYDDLYSIQYMKKNLRPYWRRNGWEAADLLKAAAHDYESLKKRCEAFDAELMADLRKVGGEDYAQLGALAYRQCFAAGKFVADANGQPLQFCKENHSNGCIGTSDVFYPMSPQFLLFGPTLAKSFLVPFMNYAASERWKFPFAPHDLGTYPHANGQVYGGGERNERNQMPVEESGNLLLLMAAIAQMEGNADFAGLYWTRLEQWAEYLKAKGFDPENQLCTDDFAGHLAHNVNLSAKAICGLGAFAKLCELRGDKAKADEYFKLAREFAQRWVKEADEGDHYRLAFDRPGTWSQKYNLMWDRILGLNLFPAEVARKEMDYYKKIQNKFGLPLDNRETYTKLDWITWTATLTQERADFEALIKPVVTFLNETPDRSPMTDWYQTKSAKKVGFTARPVVGGVFAQVLYDKALWHKWASRDRTKASNWAPIPTLPKMATVVPAADRQPAKWRYTTARPGSDWAKENFDTSAWKEGWAGFGTHETPGAVVGTVWNSGNIWLRRDVDIPADKLNHLELWFHHDDDAEVYVNGTLVLTLTGWTTSYDSFPLNDTSRKAFRAGKNLIAVHCKQNGGGQYVDLGLVTNGADTSLSSR